MKNVHKLLKKVDAARMLGISDRKFSVWIEKGFPYVDMGPGLNRKFLKRDIEAILEKKENPFRDIYLIDTFK